MFTNKNPEMAWTPDQENSLKSEIDNTFSGESNSGRPIIGNDVDYIPFGMTNKDMDYIEGRKQLKEEIYNRLKIPLSLINSNALSLANMEVASLQLYDFSILPLADKIFTILTTNVLKSYDNSENLILTYDPITIPALKERTIEELTKISKFNVLTDNELRKSLDYPTIEDPIADSV